MFRVTGDVQLDEDRQATTREVRERRQEPMEFCREEESQGGPPEQPDRLGEGKRYLLGWPMMLPCASFCPRKYAIYIPGLLDSACRNSHAKFGDTCHSV